MEPTHCIDMPNRFGLGWNWVARRDGSEFAFDLIRWDPKSLFGNEPIRHYT